MNESRMAVNLPTPECAPNPIALSESVAERERCWQALETAVRDRSDFRAWFLANQIHAYTAAIAQQIERRERERNGR